MRFDVETTLRDIEVKKATVFPGVPTMWIALANTPGIDKRDFSSLRYAAPAAPRFPSMWRERFEKLTGQRLGGGWGMTETSPAGTAMPRDGAARPGSCGCRCPASLMEVVALDDSRMLRPARSARSVSRAPTSSMAIGTRLRRRRRPSSTAGSDRRHRLHRRGRLPLLVDRKKDMIISGGFNVYPRTIEDAIYEHPAVLR